MSKTRASKAPASKAKKASSKKASAKKASAQGRPAPGRRAAPKSAAKSKTKAKKSASSGTRKPAAKKVAQKATSKRGAVRQAARKVAAAKKTAKKTARRAIAKKAPAKASAKKAPPKASAKKAPPKAPAKKAPAKASAKKAPPKKAPAKKAPPKKAPAKKAPPKKAPPKASAKKASAKKAPAKKAPAKANAAGKSGATSRAGGPATQPSPGASKTSSASGSGRRSSAAWTAARTAAATSPVGVPKVELAPRRHVTVAPSIPIPVKSVPRKPTLLQRAKRIDQRLTTQSPNFKGRYDENFEMSWIYHDTALEGVVYTFEELTTAFRSDEVTVVDSSVMPIYDAIRRQKAAIDFVREVSAKKRTPVTVDLLKTIYTTLHPEEGDARMVKYRRDIPQHRLYFHEYAAPDRIAYRVRQVIDWVNQPETRRKVGTLRMAAKAHYDLARTYPFPTDSGKVARMFMNVLLMRGGLPPAIIHATERQRYYEALKSGQPNLIVQMLRDAVENSMASIEKLLDEHETRKRGFVS